MLKLPEINIGVDGFDSHDWLDRKPTANRLSELVNRLPDPMVIALDGEWGSGKSHFLKLWVREHQIWLDDRGEDSETKIVYFDAFKHDYLDDPLAGLVIAMQAELSLDESTGDALKKAAVPLIKAVAKATNPMLEAGVDAVLKLQKSLWEQEEKRIRAIEDFKEAIAKIAGDRKIIFIIDELDRCRPDYALGILEVIKHFFHVENVHFILGANFRALEASVEATYGEKINAAGYLNKFVDLFMRFDERIGYDNKTSELEYFSKVIGKLKSKDHPLAWRHGLIGAMKIFLNFPKISEKITLRDVNHLVSRMMLLPEIRDSDVGGYIRPVAYLMASVAVLEAIDRESFKNLLNGTLKKEKVTELFHVAEREDRPTSHRESKAIIDTIHHVLDEDHEYETKQNIVEWFTTFHFADEEEEKDAGT